jgi:uncharacterized protein with FMN-binding domain
MKRITFWLLSTLSVLVLLFGYDASNASTTATPPTSIVAGTSGSTGTSSGSSSGTSTSTSTGASPSSGSSSSGSKTVTGAVASTQWGPVQVELTVAGGKITKVTVLQYPSGNPKDEEINDYALPILIQETTDQQGSGIDMVSGATVTSTGYVQSLQSAIDQAGL